MSTSSETQSISSSSIQCASEKNCALNEIEEDFSLLRAKSENTFSSDELLQILSTPRTHKFNYINKDNNRRGIVRPKNPIYKSFDSIDD